MIPRASALAQARAPGVDCVTSLTPSLAAALRADGVLWVARYLGGLTSVEVDAILGAGLGLLPVTYANRFDGPGAVVELKLLGIPPTVTVMLDAESVKLSPADTIAAISSWATNVRLAGYDPGLYVGPGIPLSAEQLGALPVDRYWESASVVPCPMLDANTFLGFCVKQLYPQGFQAGVWTDGDVIQQDYRGRLPMLCVRGPSAVDPEAATEPAPRAA